MSHEIRRTGDRYELVVDGAVASYAEVHDADGLRTIPHTVTTPGYEGRGLAAELVGHVLEETDAAGLGLIPQCPYVSHYLTKHAEHVDLVPADRRAEFGL